MKHKFSFFEICSAAFFLTPSNHTKKCLNFTKNDQFICVVGYTKALVLLGAYEGLSE